MPSTLLDKIWSSHEIVAPREGGEALLYVDRNFVHEESTWAFDSLARSGARMARPSGNIAFADHYVPTLNRGADLGSVPDPERRDMLAQLASNASRQKMLHFGIGNPMQGIMHVAAAELGFVQPGFVVTGSDSHTCTGGALGAFAFGVGQTELKQVFITSTIWRTRPKAMRVLIEGRPARGVTAKDIILSVIARVGSNGAAGFVVEYAGSCIDAMSVEQRMTLCNMSIEMGAQSGLIAPDEATFEYLAAAQYAPKNAAFDQAVAYWRTLRSDAAAAFERELRMDAATVEPMVTWGTALEDVVGVGGRVPDPADADSEEQQTRIKRALSYMGLTAGMAMRDIAIDQVFIGSCSNARIEDLRAAAAVLRGRRAVVPSVVSPGSSSVKRQAEAEGLDEIFISAGFDWRASGCSMCVGSNGDVVPSGNRCASTSPRNFEGRQGVGARTHVMSPQMAAAAAVTGRIADIRTLD